MCGRDYSTYTTEELEMRYLGKARIWRWPTYPDLPDLKPSYNRCPTQQAPVLHLREGQLRVGLMRWGLVPAWAATVKDAEKYSLINAKSEEIAQKTSYKNAFQKRRCIVPISGFFEWKRAGKEKFPFAIYPRSGGILSLAGVWEEWVDRQSGEIIDSFALVTTRANARVAEIHDRMPVILSESDEEKWLDPSTPVSELNALMQPCADEVLEMHAVSKEVNSPKNDRPEILLRASS